MLPIVNSVGSANEAAQFLVKNVNGLVAYYVDVNHCSCCAYETVSIVTKDADNTVNQYKYCARQTHQKSCAMIRCTCGAPFVWKNVQAVLVQGNDVWSTLQVATIVDEEAYCLLDFMHEENMHIEKYLAEEEKIACSQKNYNFYFGEENKH